MAVVRLLAACVLIGINATELAAEPSIAEVRSEIESTLAVMPAISVHYRMSHEVDDSGQGAAAWGPFRFHWARDGKKALFATAFSGDKPGRVVSFDGEKGYDWDPRDKSTKIHLLPEMHPSYAENDKVDVLLGLAAPNVAESLPSMLRQPTAVLVGNEHVAGVECLLVQVAQIRRGKGVPMGLRVWLDPNHGMLPRRIETTYETDGPRFKQFPEMVEVYKSAKFAWEVKEFQRVPNPLAIGGESWFPKHAIHAGSNGDTSLAIDSVQIASSLPDDWFRPRQKVGDIIFDISAGQRSGIAVGGPKRLQKRIDEIAKEVKAAESAGPPRPIAAQPARGVSWPGVGLTASIMILAAASFAWWRSRS